MTQLYFNPFYDIKIYMATLLLTHMLYNMLHGFAFVDRFFHVFEADFSIFCGYGWETATTPLLMTNISFSQADTLVQVFKKCPFWEKIIVWQKCCKYYEFQHLVIDKIHWSLS